VAQIKQHSLNLLPNFGENFLKFDKVLVKFLQPISNVQFLDHTGSQWQIINPIQKLKQQVRKLNVLFPAVKSMKIG